MVNFRKILKYGILGFLALIFVGLVGLFGFVYYTSYSESGGELVYEQSQNFLKDFFDIELESANYKIIPLKSWEFSELKISKGGENSFELSFPNVVVLFDFSPWSRSLQFSEIRMNQANLKGEFQASSEFDDDDPFADDDQDEEFNPLKQLAELFLMSFKFGIEKINVSDLKTDLMVKTDSGQARLVIESLNINGQMRFAEQRFSLNQQISILSEDKTPEVSFTKDSELSFESYLSHNSNINLNLEYNIKDNRWFLKSEKTELRTSLSQVKMRSQSESSVLDVKASTIQPLIRWTDSYEFSNLTELTQALLSRPGLSAEVDFPQLVVGTQKGRVKEKLIGLYRSSASLKIRPRDDKFNNFDVKVDFPIIESSFLRSDVSANIAGVINLDKELNQVKVDSQVAFNDIDIFRLNSETFFDRQEQSRISLLGELEPLTKKVTLLKDMRSFVPQKIELRMTTNEWLEKVGTALTLSEKEKQIRLNYDVLGGDGKAFSRIRGSIDVSKLLQVDPQLSSDHEIKGLRFQGIQSSTMKLGLNLKAEADQYVASLEVSSPRFQFKDMADIRDMELIADGNVGKDLEKINSNLLFKSGEVEHGRVQVGLSENSSGVSLNYKFGFFRAMDLLPKDFRKKLKALGAWDFESQGNVQSRRKIADLMQFEGLKSLHAIDINSNLKLTQREEGQGKFAIAASESMNVDADIKFKKNNRINSLITFSLPQLVSEKLFIMRELSGNFEFNGDYLNFEGGRLRVNIENEGLSLARADSSFESVGEIKSAIELDFTNGTLLEIMRAHLDVGDRFFSVRVSGQSNIKQKNAQLLGRVSINPGKKGVKIPGYTLKGKILVPFSLGVKRGKEAEIDGRVRFSNFSVLSPKISLKNLRGPIPFKESLSIDKNNILFLNPLARNPFARVEYKQVQPLLKQSNRISFDELILEGKKLGPFYGYLSVDQNLLSIHDFDFVLPKGGHIDGEFVLDFRPSQLAVGMLGRMTEVQLNSILKDSLTKGLNLEGDEVSLRSGVEFNMTEGLVNGRVDVLKISSNSLRALLNVVDPNYQDDQINLARSFVGFAPSRVTLDFRQGFLDLGIAFSEQDQFFNIYGVHISPIVLESLKPVREILKGIPVR